MNLVEAIRQLNPADRQEITDDLAEYAAGFIRHVAEMALTGPDRFADCDLAGLRTFIFREAFDYIEFDAEDGYTGKLEQILDCHLNVR